MIVRAGAMLTLSLALIAGCRANAGKTDRMDRPNAETLVRAPWGGDLPRVDVDEPQRGDVAGVETWKAPAVPRLRVDGAGEVAVLAYLDGRFPSADVAWATAAGGALTWRRAADPFAADRAAITAVDFVVDRRGGVVVLETVAASRSQAIVAGPEGAARGVPLDGGPYVRLVHDERGALYLVRHQGGGALVPFDAGAGTLGAPIAIAPGSPLALAANRGAVILSRLLDAPPAGTVAAPSALPEALIHLFGVDGAGDYYTAAGGAITAVSFAGEVRGAIAVAAIPALVAPATGAVRARIAPPPSWQVDGKGRIYVARATPEALEIVRLTLPR